jgi:hypothetical protein
VSIDGYVEYLYWVKDFRKKYDKKEKLNSYINFVRFPAFQNIFVLPMEKRIEYSQQILEFASRTDITQYFKPDEIILINRLAEYLKTVETPHKGIFFDELNYDERKVQYINSDLTSDFKNFFTQFDKRRNRSFEKTFPNLAEWYRNL